MLEEGLYSEIRVRAAQRGQSVSSVVGEAIRAYLAQKTNTAKLPIKLTVAKSGGWTGPMDVSSNSDLFDLCDEGLSVDQLR